MGAGFEDYYYAGGAETGDGFFFLGELVEDVVLGDWRRG